MARVLTMVQTPVVACSAWVPAEAVQLNVGILKFKLVRNHTIFRSKPWQN